MAAKYPTNAVKAVPRRVPRAPRAPADFRSPGTPRPPGNDNPMKLPKLPKSLMLLGGQSPAGRAFRVGWSLGQAYIDEYGNPLNDIVSYFRRDKLAPGWEQVLNCPGGPPHYIYQAASIPVVCSDGMWYPSYPGEDEGHKFDPNGFSSTPFWLLSTGVVDTNPAFPRNKTLKAWQRVSGTEPFAEPVPMASPVPMVPGPMPMEWPIAVPRFPSPPRAVPTPRPSPDPAGEPDGDPARDPDKVPGRNPRRNPRPNPRPRYEIPPIPYPYVRPTPGLPFPVVPGDSVVTLPSTGSAARPVPRVARAPNSSANRRPPGRVKVQRKTNVAMVGGIIWTGINTVTEIFDFAVAMHKSLPKKMQLSSKASKQDVLEYMFTDWKLWQHIDLAEGVENYVNMQVGDMAAALGSGITKNAAQATGSLSGWDRLMKEHQGNVDAAQKKLFGKDADKTKWVPELDIDMETGSVSVSAAGYSVAVNWKG